MAHCEATIMPNSDEKIWKKRLVHLPRCLDHDVVQQVLSIAKLPQVRVYELQPESQDAGLYMNAHLYTLIISFMLHACMSKRRRLPTLCCINFASRWILFLGSFFEIFEVVAVWRYDWREAIWRGGASVFIGHISVVSLWVVWAFAFRLGSGPNKVGVSRGSKHDLHPVRPENGADTHGIWKKTQKLQQWQEKSAVWM